MNKFRTKYALDIMYHFIKGKIVTYDGWTCFDFHDLNFEKYQYKKINENNNFYKSDDYDQTLKTIVVMELYLYSNFEVYSRDFRDNSGFTLDKLPTWNFTNKEYRTITSLDMSEIGIYE